MAVKDKLRNLPAIAFNQDNTRLFTKADNNKRTELYACRVKGQVDISVAGTGLSNRGSILAAVPQLFFSDGNVDKFLGDSRLLRFYNECMAPSALPGTRLATAGIQAATLLDETVYIPLSAPRTVNPSETKYVEANKQLDLNVGGIASRLITKVARGPALVGTITNLTMNVEQRYDDLVADRPTLSLFYNELAQTVAGANNQFRIDLRGARYVAGVYIQQDTDQGEVNDIINNLVLRGDRESIYGDQAIPFADLVQFQADDFGGAVTQQGGYLGINFLRYGRLSALWNPYQDTNLRLELGVQPSAVAGATGSLVRVGLIQYESTATTLPPDQIPYAI